VQLKLLSFCSYKLSTALSGIFAGTFTLTFAYISDCVEPRSRASAYGLALASLGLSFTIGPVSGGYVALRYGLQSVFISSLILVVIDVLYIIFVLPETLTPSVKNMSSVLFLSVVLMLLRCVRNCYGSPSLPLSDLTLEPQGKHP
jgi:MFS family permease